MATFADVAADALESYLAYDPAGATYLGDHRFDDRLPDPSPSAATARAAELREQLAGLDAAEVSDVAERVDAEVLRTALRAELFDLDVLREAEWNPMLHNPGNALHALLTRDFAPLTDRLAAVVGRLDAVPDYLAAARSRLGDMSRIHVETAVSQLAGTLALLDDAIPTALIAAPHLRDRVERSSAVARQAIAEHRDWLAARVEQSARGAQIGEHHFAQKLALTLDTDFAPDSLLARAQADLERVTQLITDEAGRRAGVREADAATVRRVLDELAADARTDQTILG
ncbi:MAG TPA: DUF885 family protein [Jatrophihabitantaceae bacterium]|nr:DUF885 family protein [Jatrophihabitantaceae bacterium]